MPKILIVSLKAGNGHVKAARAIELAAKKMHPDWEVRNIDLLDYASVLSKDFYGSWYMDIVNKVPKFYEWMYNRLDPSTTGVRILSDRMNCQKFQAFVFDYDPDLIFATHFVPGNLLTVWRDKYHKKYKIITTLTDYEAHPLWVDNKFNLYTVANDEAKKQMIDYGADESKLNVTGIPIDEKFSCKFDRPKILADNGLIDKFTVTIVAGAFGTGPILEILKAILDIDWDFQIIIIAGKNEELKTQLEILANTSNKTIKILGFINNMEEIMAASNIAVSKAGGLTVSESLAINLPLIIANPYPGQEFANTMYLHKNLAAFFAQKPKDIASIIENVIKKPELLDEIRANIKKIARPNAAVEIVKLGENLLK